jgi:hypothetical protein
MWLATNMARKCGTWWTTRKDISYLRHLFVNSLYIAILGHPRWIMTCSLAIPQGWADTSLKCRVSFLITYTCTGSAGTYFACINLLEAWTEGVYWVSGTADVLGDGGSHSFDQVVLGALQAQCANNFTTVTNIAENIEFVIWTYIAATGEAAPVWLK